MAAAAQVQTAARQLAQQRIQAWRETALALAVKAHLDGTAHFAGLSGRTTSCWSVPSRDRGGRYEVRVNERTGGISCHCSASRYGYPCSHAGAVIQAIQQRAAAKSRPESPFDSWLKGWEW